MESESLKLAKTFLGKNVEVTIDRPLDSTHPKHNFLYEVNYGYIRDIMAPDGEELEFINKDTLETLGHAKITPLKIKTLGTLTEEDWFGHEKFPSKIEMYEAYKKYYGDKVNKDSEVKIITFDFNSNKF